MSLRVLSVVVAAFVACVQFGVKAQPSPGGLQIRATTDTELRAWDAFTTRESRSGGLRLRSLERDPAMPGRTVERFDQFYQGVRVWGADLVRDSERGVATAIFGHIDQSLALSIVPRLSAEQGAAALLGLAGADAVMLKKPELVVLRLDSGEHRLAYSGVVSGDEGVFRAFVDAERGAELLRISEIHYQAAVGMGRGVLGDQKKISVLQQGGMFLTDDQHRPPVLTTYDFRGNFGRALTAIDGGPLLTSDIASDSDNDWTNSIAVDGHVHVGWTYDYFFKRFERRGLDNQDRAVIVLTNGLTPQAALTADPEDLFTFGTNAFWCGVCGPGGVGVMYFGSGIPSGFFFVGTGQNWEPTVGSLDIAAHELTHGVTASSSRLINRNESGALNEAFSDIMGASVEFFFHPPGAGRGQADYVIGEDTVRGIRPGAPHGIRSLENPVGHGHPDHYSRRFTGTGDNGGVHINCGIVNHAFYLAIEGGTNRTSGLSVQGVGAANREQIERVFFRAFVFLLPANATFSTARAATIQAARDLYASNSAVERAVTQAWTAVGVN